MPAIPASIHKSATLNKRIVSNDDGDISVPRLLGIIFVIAVVLVILFFGIRSFRRRRGPLTYNTRRNQGHVRVQRLEGRGGGSGNTNDGDSLPSWRQSLRHQRVSPAVVDDGGLVAPPPVYKRQDSTTVHMEPPPAYPGRGDS